MQGRPLNPLLELDSLGGMEHVEWDPLVFSQENMGLKKQEDIRIFLNNQRQFVRILLDLIQPTIEIVNDMMVQAVRKPSRGGFWRQTCGCNQ